MKREAIKSIQFDRLAGGKRAVVIELAGGDEMIGKMSERGAMYMEMILYEQMHREAVDTISMQEYKATDFAKENAD